MDVRQGGDSYPATHGKSIMYEHHRHRHGQSAGVQMSSSRVHPAHVVAGPVSANLASVKPGTSWHVDFSTFTSYRTTGFAKTGQRPRGAFS
ncbi:MAG: hypothetical protein VYD11_00495 [Actinomycetota bacterium]|nr:hypothetical protein [Actinomycetota bacterium]MED5232143.1 hypothetical protein [Actinomycetota bacterium]